MQLRNKSLTPIQGLLVCLAVLVIAVGVYGLYAAARQLRCRRGAKASIPIVLNGLREHRDLLAKAIESYHGQLGFYPPDHATGRIDRAVANSLYYELVGTRWIPGNKTFGLPTTKDPIRPDEMKERFNSESFSNSVLFPAWPTNFLNGLLLHGQVHDGVIGVSSASSYYFNVPEEFFEAFAVSTWRYAVNPAEHNPGKFDIWTEIDVLGQHFVIGNWEQVR